MRTGSLLTGVKSELVVAYSVLTLPFVELELVTVAAQLTSLPLFVVHRLTRPLARSPIPYEPPSCQRKCGSHPLTDAKSSEYALAFRLFAPAGAVPHSLSHGHLHPGCNKRQNTHGALTRC